MKLPPSPFNVTSSGCRLERPARGSMAFGVNSQGAIYEHEAGGASVAGQFHYATCKMHEPRRARSITKALVWNGFPLCTFVSFVLTISKSDPQAELRSAGQPGAAVPTCSTSEDARAYIESLASRIALARRQIRLGPHVRQGSLPPSAPPTPDRFRSQWRPGSPLCARSGPPAGRPGPTGWPIALPEAPGRGPGRRLSLSCHRTLVGRPSCFGSSAALCVRLNAHALSSSA